MKTSQQIKIDNRSVRVLVTSDSEGGPIIQVYINSFPKTDSIPSSAIKLRAFTDNNREIACLPDSKETLIGFQKGGCREDMAIFRPKTRSDSALIESVEVSCFGKIGKFRMEESP
jgi:hypothetical protein